MQTTHRKIAFKPTSTSNTGPSRPAVVNINRRPSKSRPSLTEIRARRRQLDGDFEALEEYLAGLFDPTLGDVRMKAFLAACQIAYEHDGEVELPSEHLIYELVHSYIRGGITPTDVSAAVKDFTYEYACLLDTARRAIADYDFLLQTIHPQGAA